MTDRPNPSDDDPDDPTGTDDPAAIDEAFEAIVSGIRHAEQPPDVPLWPVAEDDEPSAAPAPAPQLGSSWSGWEDIALPAPTEELDDVDDSDDDDAPFVPPTPPPIPKGDPVLRWAWAGALGAPVLAVVLAIVGWDFDGLVGLGLVAAFLTGFGTLIYRMRTGPDDLDTPDDGAVV